MLGRGGGKCKLGSKGLLEPVGEALVFLVTDLQSLLISTWSDVSVESLHPVPTQGPDVITVCVENSDTDRYGEHTDTPGPTVTAVARLVPSAPPPPPGASPSSCDFINNTGSGTENARSFITKS